MSDQLALFPTFEGFDPFGALPSRRMAIEASAGTGKTHALATLATRFVAESGVAASELLIVTFTRAAANELRAKVRQRFIDTAEVLETGSPDQSSDINRLAAHLASVDGPERTRRLRRAVTEFDAATVTTIHGFAFQVRAALGTGTGSGPNDRILSDHRVLLREACNDVLAAAAVGPEADLGLPELDGLVRITEQVDGRPDLRFFPPADLDGVPPPLSVLATLVTRSAELAQLRRRAAGMLSFDDVLTRFRQVLADPSIGASAARYLTARYRVILIDEFQDTDPVQWDIFSSLFGKGDGRSSLVVVGDPKQSIYGFRGADVHTYRRAVNDPATAREVLGTNWRSDEALLDALSALLTGATFGEDIKFLPVEAAPGHAGRMLDADGHHLAALSLRLAVGEDITRHKLYQELVTVGPAKTAILRDLAATVCRLLDGAVIPASDGSGPGRRVRPGDVAVLVPKNQYALDVQSALRDAHIPAVVARAGSVLESEAATHLRWLLHAMERPSDLTRVRLAALSWFGGWTARQVAEAGDDDADGVLTLLQERVRSWADALSSQPVAAVLARIRSESGLVERLLAQPEGDRYVTDLDHLCELLGSTTASGRSGPATLLAYLDEEPEPTGDGDAIIDVDEDLTARRLESDADCVQVMTTWTAKGLEFPIVCLPMLWWESNSPFQPPDEYFAPGSECRTIDLTAGKKDYREFPDLESAAERHTLIDRESDDERLRTLYVALTRAKHMNIMWWARTEQSECSAMARVLFGRADGSIEPGLFSAHHVTVPADGQAVAFLDPVVAEANRRHAAAMSVHVIGADTEVPVWNDPDAPMMVTDLDVADAPKPDRRYQRWSFSAIVDRAAIELADPTDDSLADAGAADEAEEEIDANLDDGGVGGTDVSGSDPAGQDPPAIHAAAPTSTAVGDVNPMADLAGGTTFGTLVHSVLERTDWQASDLDLALGDAVDDCLAWRPVELTTAVPSSTGDPSGSSGRSQLIAGLHTALHAPLRPQFANGRLVDLRRRDRIAELTFDLHLGTDGHLPSMSLLGEAIRDGLPTDDPCLPWAEALAEGSHDLVLGGNLTGSIDLIARVKDADGNPRFVIADYKTNTLHVPGTAARAADYGSTRLAVAMAEHDYPLQALLYSVALHRYLRWRLPGYEPERHLGGVAYLFIRGMSGRAAVGGTADGVFSWLVPPALVAALSDLLDGARVGVPG